MHGVRKKLEEYKAEFDAWAATKREQICTSEKVIAIQKNTEKHNKEYNIMVAIAEVLGGSGFVTAAYLITTYGLEKYCELHWSD